MCVDKKNRINNLILINNIVMFLIDLISMSNKNSINLNIDDIKTIINKRKKIFFATAESFGTKTTSKTVEKILESSLLDGMYISGVSGVLIHFCFCATHPLVDISNAMNIIYDSVPEEVEVIFDSTVDNNLSKGCVKVTILVAK